MSMSISSPHWHRVAGLRIRLRPHVSILRRSHRDGLHYLLQDDVTGQFHRFTPEAWQVIGRLDGRRTVQEVWEAVSARLGDRMPTQMQVINLLGQLQRADLVQSDRSPDVGRLVRRGAQERRAKRFRRLASPMSVYVPLLDPERLLEATRWLGRMAFSRAGLIVWLAAVLSGLLVLVLNWRFLTHGLADQVFAAENLLLVMLIYPVTKVLHELGHALAVKRWGGQVHEMGVVLIILLPVPYVDATAASAFPQGWQRAVVGAAGMMVDLLVAAVACWVWLLAEPGVPRALAMNVVLIAGISTLVFNGNPLLRFDAYYILSDLARIPNLASRSNRQLGYWFCRLAGVRSLASPSATAGEAASLGAYAVLSFAYRGLVIIGLAMLLASHYFVLGVLLACWALVLAYVWPALKLVALPARDGRLRDGRSRLYGLGLGLLAALLALTLVVPMPFATRAQGIVWAGDDAVLRAGAPGFVQRVVATPNGRVRAGETLIELVDPELDARVAVTRADLQRAEREYQANQQDPNLAVAYQDSLRFLRGQLDREIARRTALQVVAPWDGEFRIASPDELVGSYVRRGDLLSFVVDAARMHVTALVPEEAIAIVRERTVRIEVRLASNPGEVLPARLLRQMPAATQELPSRVLSLEGGGPFALDPRQPSGNLAFQRLFRLDLAVPGIQGRRLEERVHIRFVHPPEPVGERIYRWARTTFMRQFGV
jgi:putative peptide zinc metalloprotease protein